MSEAKALWQERLNESTAHLEPEVTADICAERYDVADRDEVVELTNAALEHAFDAGFGSVALEDLDAADDDTGVIGE